jgi:hypothetical protein
VYADARVKEDRRKEWDRVIAEAKAGNPIDETAIPKSTNGQRKADKLNFKLEYYRARDDLGSWNNTSWRAPSPLTGYIPPGASLRRLDDELKSLVESPHENLIVPGEPSPFSPGQSEGWYDEDDFEALPSEHFTPREPLKGEYKDKLAELVRSLVDQLLLTMDIFSIGRAGTTSINTNLDVQTIEMAQRIEKLQTAFILMPAYSWDEISQEQRTALHKSLVTACANTTPDRSNIELLVAKICYNLLISTTPPSIGTYNILIRAFSRLQLHDLAQSVVDSFYQSKMKPNERTIKLILDHYVAKKDPLGFQNTINRMSAAHGNMLIKSRTVYQLSSPDNLQWATMNRVRRRGSWLSQKVDRSPAIFESLIRGSFELKALRPTIRFINAALREGQMVHPRSIYNAVEACVTQLDYKSARILLRVILSAWENSSTSVIDLSPDCRYAFHKLLSLCNIDPALDSNPVLPPFVSLHTLRDLMRWLRMESIENSLNRCENFVLSLEMTLEKLHPQLHDIYKPSEPPTSSSPFSKEVSLSGERLVRDQDIRRAFDLLQGFSRREQIRKVNRERHNAEFRSIRLQSLQTEFDELATSTANVAREIEVYCIRQTRWSKIRAIEAELAAQVDSFALEGYDVVPLFFDQLSIKSWDKFITKVRNVQLAGLSFYDPLDYVLRLISRDRLGGVTTLQGQQSYVSERNLDEDVTKAEKAIGTPKPELDTFGEGAVERSPFRHQLPSPFAALSQPENSVLSFSPLPRRILNSAEL